MKSIIGKPIFVITGKLKDHTREEMHKKIREAGGIPEISVTGSTNYLIVGDTGRHGVTTKMIKARRSGVNVLTEESFSSLSVEDLKRYIQGLKDINEILMAFEG